MLKVRDIMTREVHTLACESTIREAMELMTTNHLSGAPVMSGDRPAGVVSMTDILGFISGAPEPGVGEQRVLVVEGIENLGDDLSDVEEANLLSMTEDMWEDWTQSQDRGEDADDERSDLLDRRTVEEIMSPEIVSVAPTASVREAASMMRRHAIHRLLVMEGKSLVGIISALDIARAVSERGLAQKKAK